MSVTWTLKDPNGSNLSHQPSTGSPLALKFNNSGEAHLSGYPGELIDTIECAANVSSVTIELTPDNTGYELSESASDPQKNPSMHGGTMSWTPGSAGLTTLVFSVPSASGTYGWDFGLSEPAVALKVKVRTTRE